MAVCVPPSRPIQRVLVCGGRDVSDSAWIYKILSALHESLGFDTVIEGDARGADRIASSWARTNGVENVKFPANWDAYGSAAGPIRNQQMLNEGKPDMVIAFAGGRGTQDMLRRAEKAGIPWTHHQFEPKGNPHPEHVGEKP